MPTHTQRSETYQSLSIWASRAILYTSICSSSEAQMWHLNTLLQWQTTVTRIRQVCCSLMRFCETAVAFRKGKMENLRTENNAWTIPSVLLTDRFSVKYTCALYQEHSVGGCSLCLLRSMGRNSTNEVTAAPLSRQHRLHPGPCQLSGNMCRWSQGGPWEGTCVWLCANLSPLMVNQL